MKPEVVSVPNPRYLWLLSLGHLLSPKLGPANL